MPIPAVEPGDTFLLFNTFPFDFSVDLPVSTGAGVCLDSTPQAVLDSADPKGLADYVLPGYSFIGGLVQCCLRKPRLSQLPEGMNASQALFLSVVACRLTAPFGIEVSSQFRLETAAHIGQPTLYLLKSSWQPESEEEHKYTGDDLGRANRIGSRIAEVTNARRFASAYVLFAQVTVGMTTSLQLATMGLFAALEALYAPDGNKAQTLGQRVAHFLSRVNFPFEIGGWLEEEYIQRRSQLMHGIQDILAWRWDIVASEKIQAFARLHELVRFSLLGFLCLSDELIHSHSALNGTRLRHLLANLAPAHGTFLDGQRVWCD